MTNVRKGSKAGPWSIVVYKGKKVLHQRPVKILQQIPAHYEDVKKKYPNDKIGIEDKYGERVYTESVNEAIEPSGIMAKINKVVQDKQAAKISGVLMDKFSAGIMMQIFNAVKDKSKEQMNKGNIRQVQVILHKVMKQNKVTK